MRALLCQQRSTPKAASPRSRRLADSAVQARSPSSRCAPQYHASASSARLPGGLKPKDALSPHTLQRRLSGAAISVIGSSIIAAIRVRGFAQRAAAPGSHAPRVAHWATQGLRDAGVTPGQLSQL